MRRRLWLALALAQIGSLAAAAAQTAEELIAKNIEARGGLAKIQAIQSVRMTGTISVGGVTMPAVLEVKRPDKTRLEFTVNGQVAVQAYDGTTAWAVLPFTGKTEAERMSAEDSRDMELQADMDGPLVNYKAKGNRVELMGVQKVADQDAWRLKVTLRNGDVQDIYLDLKTHLQIATVAHRVVQGKPAEVESELGDYREVGGVLLPHSFETKAEGVSQKQSIRFNKIELNVPTDDSRFRMPAAKKPTEAPPTMPPRG